MDNQSKSGFCVDIAVREVPGKGRGVFAQEPVTKGTIVWRYLPGLFELFDETAFTSAINGMSHEQVVYELTHVLGMDDFPDCVIKGLDEGFLINHEDDANLATNFGVPLQTKPDPTSANYLEDVAKALLEDRFALVTTRDIQSGEEFSCNYSGEIYDPPFYLRLYEEYGIREDYLEED